MKNRKMNVFFTVLLGLFIIGCGSVEDEKQAIVIQEGDLSIHFLELGNKYVGDCVFINYGDIEIIIDAGSKQESATTIFNYIDKYIDGKLDFVIATHAHEDHIAGFYTRTVSGTKVKGILEAYDIDIIIDFPMKNNTTATYNNYVSDRDKAVKNGATHYNALQCYNNTDGAKREWDLGGGVYLEILYNYYYEHETEDKRDENDYSVCVRIVQGDKQYIFTGDLEEDGENKLVDYYAENHGGLGHCVLYKAGHHGSNTSSHEKLMAEISPEYICVCTCVGTTQYTTTKGGIFPTQNFINRIAPYTDAVYLTTLATDYSAGKFEPFNGNIVFLVQNGNCSIICSNNNLKLKDTKWFVDNRKLPPDW